jgi:tetratricopeptide (TPR) repeat protein
LLLRPEDPGMLLDLSNLLMDNGQGRAAIACLKRMTTVDPDNVSGWQNLAVAQFMRGQYDQGIASCEEALSRDPANLLTLFNLALAHENLGRYGEALRWVARGLAVEPRDLSFQKLEFRLRVLRLARHLRRGIGKLMIWRYRRPHHNR